jgi:putative intracellular protease/amidase
MLEGKHIDIMVDEDFEDSELTEPLRAMKDSGAIWADEPIVIDGNVFTSRRPFDFPKPNKEIIEALL